MRLPFSSTNYSEPAQNLTFLNDISNMRSQINTLASAAAESSASGSDTTQLGDYTNPHWREQRVLRIGGIVDNGGNPDTSTQNILEWVEAELPPTPAGAFSGQILRLTHDSSRFTNLRATWQAFPTIHTSNIADNAITDAKIPVETRLPGALHVTQLPRYGDRTVGNVLTVAHGTGSTGQPFAWMPVSSGIPPTNSVGFSQLKADQQIPTTGIAGQMLVVHSQNGNPAWADPPAAPDLSAYVTTANLAAYATTANLADYATTTDLNTKADNTTVSSISSAVDLIRQVPAIVESGYVLMSNASGYAWRALTPPPPPYWALNMGSANKPIVNGMLDSSYFLGTGQQGGNASSGVTMSNGVVTITTAGYYSLTFTIELYQATATLIHVDQHIKYEAGGGTPSSATPHIASAMNIWTDIQYSQSTQEAVTSYANTLQVLRYLQAGSKLQCFLQTFSGSPSAYLIGNRSTHFSGFRVG